MKQTPTNSNYGTTCHKLQGMLKDAIIVLSWPTGGMAAMFKSGSMSSYPVCEHCWDYTLLNQLTWKSHSNHLLNSNHTWTNKKIWDRNAARTSACNSKHICKKELIYYDTLVGLYNIVHYTRIRYKIFHFRIKGLSHIIRKIMIHLWVCTI